MIRSNALYKLTPAKMKELDKLGFQHQGDAITGLLNMSPLYESTAKSCYDKRWRLHVQELKAFKKAHGHCEVPVNMKENSNLVKWIRSTRGSRNARKMSAERMEELDSIGFRHCRDPSAGLGFDFIDSTKKISQQTQKEGSSQQRKLMEHVRAPQDFKALNNGHCDDGFVSSGVSDGENMAPKVDRKKCLEEDFMKTHQP
jgi:hypothetical protein